jgi:hypothetical protein
MTMLAATPLLPARLAKALDTPDGGFSVNTKTGENVTSGYALSIYPEFERQIKGRVTAREIERYMWDHSEDLAVENVVFGGWRDPETGIAFLDVSMVINDRTEALRLARQYDQLAVFDFATMESVPVGTANPVAA